MKRATTIQRPEKRTSDHFAYSEESTGRIPRSRHQMQWDVTDNDPEGGGDRNFVVLETAFEKRDRKYVRACVERPNA